MAALLRAPCRKRQKRQEHDPASFIPCAPNLRRRAVQVNGQRDPNAVLCARQTSRNSCSGAVFQVSAGTARAPTARCRAHPSITRVHIEGAKPSRDKRRRVDPDITWLHMPSACVTMTDLEASRMPG